MRNKAKTNVPPKHRSTKYVCPNCGNVFAGSIDLDELGWHTSCPECRVSFDVDVPEGRFVIAFVDDERIDAHNLFTDYFRGNAIISYFAVDTEGEFINLWASICDKPVEDNGMWYWCLDYKDPVSPVLLTSGACDPGDIDFFEEYSDEMAEAVRKYREKGGDL